MATGPQNPTVTTIPSVATEITALQQSGYQLNTLKYPDDIGGPEVPSYITFNIYVPTSSTYESQTAPSLVNVRSQSQINSDYEQSTAGKPQVMGAGGPGSAAAAGVLYSSKQLGGISGIISAPIESVGVVAGGIAAAEVANSAITDLNISLRPPLRRIQQSVSIYMPDTVMMQMSHDYNKTDATAALGAMGLAGALGSSLDNAFGMKSIGGHGFGGDMKTAFGNLKKMFSELPAGAAKLAKSSIGTEALGKLLQNSGMVGGGFTALALRSKGTAVNPQAELLYNGTDFRSFQFLFRFQPRTPQESQIITTIIQVFKYFSSPGIQTHTYGRYFTIPGQFDISFHFNNTVNPFISKISTCVLRELQVDYNPQGQFATMTDGALPEITLQLNFMESDIIYSNIMASPDGTNVAQGF